MINTSTVNSIRQQRRDGFSISDIAKMNGVSRDTVYKHLARDDFSPRPPARRSAPSELDPYKPVIRQWLEDDARNWRKQRHTARRIWRRLVDEHGADVSEPTVGRYVAELRRRDRSQGERFLDLVWEPGRAQADFGEADFYVSGVRTRLANNACQAAAALAYFSPALRSGAEMIARESDLDMLAARCLSDRCVIKLTCG